MSVTTPFAKLKRKRGAVKTRITKFAHFLDANVESPDTDKIKVKLDVLIEAFKTIAKENEELIELDPDSIDGFMDELEEIEEEYDDVLSRAQKIMRKAQTSSEPPATCTLANPVQPVNFTPKLRLPEISLPTFDGSIEKFQAFKDRFTSRIDSKAHLSDVDKLQYLQASLSGKAARAIDSMESTEANYKAAWEILKKKYDNSRLAIMRHWTILNQLTRLAKDSPPALDELVDTFRQHLRALKSLGQPTEQWDTCILYLLLNKINEQTRYEWETTLKDSKIPAYTDLLEFLEQRGCCSEQFTSKTQEAMNKSSRNKHGGTGYDKSLLINAQERANEKRSCVACNEAHSIYKCSTFRGMPILQRKQLVTQNSLCYNCLGTGHNANDCKGGLCRVCNGRHHTFLHKKTPVENPSTSASNSKTPVEAGLHSGPTKSFIIPTSSDDLIPTALIYVTHRSNNTSILCRAIIDSASSRNFITEELAAILKLPIKKAHISIGGLNYACTSSNTFVTATIKSRINGFQKTLELFIVPRITSLTPDQTINRRNLNIPANLKLADPEFHRPAPVHLLIGAGTSLSILCIGNIKMSLPHEPDLTLQKTLFGWIIAGNIPTLTTNPTKVQCFALNTEDISKFWELEEIHAPAHLSAEEAQCEKHFASHTKRDTDGRYIISLPFNSDKEFLGESYHMALKRLENLKRRFSRNADLRLRYYDAIQKYINLGYLVKINDDQNDGVYLPHQATMKESSLTTKVRVVFDASAKTNSGYSRNDTLLSGPTIQSDLLSLLLRFRTHNYVLTGDIEKMYLQVKIHPDDQRFLRILWKDYNGHASKFQFNRLIFGLRPASYLATRCVHKLADDEKILFPRASTIIKTDLYVDDLLTGANTLEEVIKLRQEITELLKRGGFNLRQCASNSVEVIETIPDHKINLLLQEGRSSTLKTLGVHWNSAQDSIVYTVNGITNNRITKRTIFSEVARTFDPLGLLNPVMVTAKLLIQELWQLKVDWDESLPIEIITRWRAFATQLPMLNEISFDRKILLNHVKDVQIHGFCDASLMAYGACLYMRSVDITGGIKIQLICAKSRVAPIKTKQKIPRLELCGAKLLATLYHAVKSAINIEVHKTLFWTDSMIAWHWIKTSPHTLKTFVANRVADIQAKSEPNQWRHVRSQDNPADLLSRGLFPAEFKEAKLWTSGPAWLSEDENRWPTQHDVKIFDLPEVRKSTCLVTHHIDTSILSRYSSYDRLRHIVALCLRMLPSNKEKGSLTAQELQSASTRILLLIQKSAFAEEFKALIKGEDLSRNSKLLSLNPILGRDGLIRVGGRLHQSPYSYQKKAPHNSAKVSSCCRYFDK